MKKGVKLKKEMENEEFNGVAEFLLGYGRIEMKEKFDDLYSKLEE